MDRGRDEVFDAARIAQSDRLSAVLRAHPAMRAALLPAIDEGNHAWIAWMCHTIAHARSVDPPPGEPRDLVVTSLLASSSTRPLAIAAFFPQKEPWLDAPVFDAWLRTYLLFWVGPSPTRARCNEEGYWARARMYRDALHTLTMYAPYALPPANAPGGEAARVTHVLMLEGFRAAGSGRYALPRSMWLAPTVLPLVEFGARAPCRLFVDMETPAVNAPRKALAFFSRLGRDAWDVARMHLRLWVPPRDLADPCADGPPRVVWTQRLRAVPRPPPPAEPPAPDAPEPKCGWKLGLHLTFHGIVAPNTKAVRAAARIACATLRRWHGHDPSAGPYATLDMKGMNTGLRALGAKWKIAPPPDAPHGVPLPVVIGLPYHAAWVSHPRSARGPTDLSPSILPPPADSDEFLVETNLAAARASKRPIESGDILVPPHGMPKADKHAAMLAARKESNNSRYVPGWPMRCRIDGQYRGFMWLPAGERARCLGRPACWHSPLNGPQRACEYIYHPRTGRVLFTCKDGASEGAATAGDSYAPLSGFLLEM